jgi:ABC-type branched-subunit amino acid transport system substrate-binding protein
MSMSMTVAATVPLSGRYAAQGSQMRAGLEAWARWAGARLVLEDDESRPERAAARYRALLRRCELVLGPYGSDSVRAVASSGLPGPLWNHGGAADDVQRLPGVVSIPSPASRYLVALARAVAHLRPAARVALVIADGRFARLAREGLEPEAPLLGLRVTGTFAITGALEPLLAAEPDAVLLCGPVEQEVALLRRLAGRVPLVGGLSPGLAAFPELFGASPDGLLAPAQWHPRLTGALGLGPATAEVLAAARELGAAPIDYVGAQAFACALVAARCAELEPDDPLGAARGLKTATFFGGFALDPESGIQCGHRLCVVRWRGAAQELLLADAA